MGRIISTLLFFSLVFSADLFSQEKNSQLHKIRIVAHRGAARFAPENTIASFLKAAEMGADYAEMDVRQTKDGEFVIMHDKTVNRTTNGNGEVSGMTWPEIQKLETNSGEKVPALKEVLTAIKGKILPDLDFKEGDPEALVKLLKEEGYLEQGNVLFHGSWKNCEAIKKATDKILIRPAAKDGVNGFQKLLEALDPPVVNINRGGFSEYYINLIHQKGKLAFVNALRRADNKRFMKRAIAAGADFLQADKLDILAPLVKEHNQKLKAD